MIEIFGDKQLKEDYINAKIKLEKHGYINNMSYELYKELEKKFKKDIDKL